MRRVDGREDEGSQRQLTTTAKRAQPTSAPGHGASQGGGVCGEWRGGTALDVGSIFSRHVGGGTNDLPSL